MTYYWTTVCKVWMKFISIFFNLLGSLFRHLWRIIDRYVWQWMFLRKPTFDSNIVFSFWNFLFNVKHETIKCRVEFFAIEMSQEDIALLPTDSGISTPKRKNDLFKPTTGKINSYIMCLIVHFYLKDYFFPKYNTFLLCSIK